MAVDRWIYPRTVSILRPGTNLAIGKQSYSGNVRTDEMEALTGLAASIQEAGVAGAPLPKLPGAPRQAVLWRIFIPVEVLSDPAAIKTDDIARDDLDRRFLVVSAYFNSLGFNLRGELLEA